MKDGGMKCRRRANVIKPLHRLNRSTTRKNAASAMHSIAVDKFLSIASDSSPYDRNAITLHLLRIVAIQSGHPFADIAKSFKDSLKIKTITKNTIKNSTKRKI